MERIKLERFAEYLIEKGVVKDDFIQSNGKPFTSLLFIINDAYKKSKVNETMKQSELKKIINEEIQHVLVEFQNLEDIKLNAALQKKMDLFIKEVEGTPNLTKLKVAAILNDVIDALGLNKVQITSYMNMLKQYKAKEASLDKKKKSDIRDM